MEEEEKISEGKKGEEEKGSKTKGEEDIFGDSKEEGKRKGIKCRN